MTTTTQPTCTFIKARIIAASLRALMAATCLLQASPHALADDAAFFTEVAPGVVKDSRTGLEWMRCSLGQQWSATANTCTGDVKKYNWQGAQDIAKKFNSMGGNGGKAGWRVPTIREWQSIRYCSKGFTSWQDLQDGQPKVRRYCIDGSTKPSIDLATFPATPVEWYWSSTLYAGNSPLGWFVSFYDGGIGYSYDDGYRNSGYAVRLVR